MRILAIDPGYERMGVAVLERMASKEQVLYSTCLETSRTLTFSERLHSLGQEVERLIKKWKPAAVAIEKLYFTTNQKTGIQIAEVRGMLLYITRDHDLTLYEYTPLEVKVAIAGYGKADKKQVTTMVRALTKLNTEPKHDDEYDAIAIGLTCFACLACLAEPRRTDRQAYLSPSKRL